MRPVRGKNISEQDLARVVVTWLQDSGWDVYQEVQMCTYGHVADIVATQGKLLWAIECKASLGLAVMEQAERWTSYAHYVSVAVPYGRRNRLGITDRILRYIGVGCLNVSQFGDGEVSEIIHPALRRRISPLLRQCLREDQKTFAAAGNSAGLRLTPWSHTCRQVLLEVERRPGLTIKELVAGMNTHYSTSATARSCLSRWAIAGKIRGVRADLDGRMIRLYPSG